jgi:DNA-binding GntR family transcriptional regulator
LTRTISTTKTQEAYTQLKDMIRAGEFAPGERLVEMSLAKKLGVSRATTRETLLRLEAEGLLKGRGAYGGKYVEYVEDAKPGDLIAVYELREVVEGLAARLAAKNMTGWEIDELSRLERRIAEAVARGDTNARYTVNPAFHRYLLEHCGNPLLLDVWGTYHLSPPRPRTREFERRLLANAPRAREPQPTLKGVVEAIARHDPDLAERRMRGVTRQITEAIRRTMVQGAL